MGKKLLIEVSHLSKSYPKLTTASHRFHALKAILKGKNDYPAQPVLEDISFSLYQGESLGIIGENGAGKSTLLKHIAGVIPSSQGKVQVFGRIGALLELGAGFHPEYTGRENLWLSGALMGMSQGEIKDNLEQIISFADIRSYIDSPIKHYSSGMVVRLGFALMTALKPEILITDEVLAVGDESFQKKCIQWLENYLTQGGTLLLCSHSMFHIQKLCQKALWIHQGQVMDYGDAFGVSQAYLSYHEKKTSPQRVKFEVTAKNTSATYHLTELVLEGDNFPQIPMGGQLKVKGMVYSPDNRPPVVAIGIIRANRAEIYGLISDIDRMVLQPVVDHLFTFQLVFPNIALLPGQYTLRAHGMDPEGVRLFDTMEQTFQVTGQTRELGVCRLDHEWQ
ncbi:polysaccharide ABC transporter ATP-binding protein [Candidatus Nitrosacidococcus sp. I8]|uniref:ABC transporter ATP-binding protein n=1 Tax=Candidatus Nitrosacidococcus sp. I8 TaxID=2942908 RepID=UPI002226B43B|nr:polysaccharide ABC transporter ATP-binding protein [Candidatus Nitrosacidococcus sp. I8]CAH9014869.1 Vitamin B12 import ATP-binding protein BtuD [Candidatus Nitrosacidococcus sp. I8]